jgi:hypothetical protein
MDEDVDTDVIVAVVIMKMDEHLRLSCSSSGLMKEFSALTVLKISLVQKPQGLSFIKGQTREKKPFYPPNKPIKNREIKKKALWYSMSSPDPISCRFCDASP